MPTLTIDVVHEVCGKKLRVWYTPSADSSAYQDEECPACHKGIALG